MSVFDLSRTMTEAELLAGITEALELAGWRWTHIRDSRGVTMGDEGLPDIIATHPDRDVVLAWELKSERGRLSHEQAAWLSGMRDRRVDARIIRPADYDDALEVVLGRRKAPAEIASPAAAGAKVHDWPVDHARGE